MIKELIDKTPCFLFDESLFLDEYDKLSKACKTFWNNYKIGYSVKTNSLPSLLQYFEKNTNMCAEVVSLDEYELVKHLGYPAEKIICNGPIKEEDWVQDILSNNTIINIDSHHEVNYILEYAKKNKHQNLKIGIRVGVDLEVRFPNETNMGIEGTRFGFCLENGALSTIVEKLNTEENINIVGIHMHSNTKNRKPETYGFLTEKFCEITKKLKLNDIHYFDIGGGFWGGIEGKPNWNDYLSVISKTLLENSFSPQNLTLILEPGVSLIAGAFSYYSKVKNVKQTNRNRFAVLDGSRTHIDPFFHKASYFCEKVYSAHREKEDGAQETCLVGFTCLENDRFFKSDKWDIQEGDIFKFDKVGAYTSTLSPLFISYFPNVFCLDKEGQVQHWREKWTYQEFIQKSILK